MIETRDEVKTASSLPLESWYAIIAKVAVIAGLLVWFYWDSLVILVNIWRSNPDWSHGFVIPFFSIYMIYAWREKIFSAVPNVCYIGLGVMAVAICMKAYGLVVLHNDWVQHISLPLLIWGIVLYLCGWRIAMILFVPIFFLELGMPLPESLYVKISVPMQEMAAKMSGAILRLFGANIQVTNSFIRIESFYTKGEFYPLEVAEACSGMRSLMAFVALGVAIAFIDERPLWQRIVIMLGGIPIALICNIIRVTLTCTMFAVDKPELGKDIMHELMGMMLLVPALILLLLLAKLLDSMYEEVDDEEHEQLAGQEPAGGEA